MCHITNVGGRQFVKRNGRRRRRSTLARFSFAIIVTKRERERERESSFIRRPSHPVPCQGCQNVLEQNIEEQHFEGLAI